MKSERMGQNKVNSLVSQYSANPIINLIHVFLKIYHFTNSKTSNILHSSTLKENNMTISSHILGFPRIGAQRELKFALESFWRGDSDVTALQNVANSIKTKNWQAQIDAQLTHVTVGDFAFYDQMLNQSLMLGCIPKRFDFDANHITLAQTFDLARGNAAQPAMEMTKWFDTNYHYLVPELARDIQFNANADNILIDIDAVLALDGDAKRIVIG